jgi:hypothetical protein
MLLNRSINTVKHLPRYREVANVFIKYGFASAYDYLNLPFFRLGQKTDPVDQRGRRKSAARRLRNAFEELGPTYIKMGQLLSTRADWLNPEFIEELEHLQDQVPSFPLEQVQAILAEEGIDLEQDFSFFNPQPIAAASIGQVHEGVLSSGMNKEMLQDLLLFYSSRERKMVTLSEYVSRMPEDQKYIYYAAGESIERIDKMPQTELITDKGYEILYFTEDVDEFAIRMLMNYQEKEFKSVSSGDLGIDPDTDKENQDLEEKDKELFQYMKNVLGDKVKDVRASKRLKNHPVCLANEGDLTIEMEKILNAIPTDQKIKAERILEINNNHEVFQSLREAFANDKEKLDLYTHLLYNQALMIEGLPLEDPLEFSNNICSIMK